MLAAAPREITVGYVSRSRPCSRPSGLLSGEIEIRAYFTYFDVMEEDSGVSSL